jgi:uncharacterized protein YxjI
MKLLFKQRLFSWFDSYDISYEDGSVAYTVRGKLAWGHRLEIYDPAGSHLGTVKEKVLTLLPRFELYIGGDMIGHIKKELTFFKPAFTLDCNGWEVRGDLWQWNYQVHAPGGQVVMEASKQVFNWTDTYIIDVADPGDAVLSLMIVLAIDAAKCEG